MTGGLIGCEQGKLLFICEWCYLADKKVFISAANSALSSGRFKTPNRDPYRNTIVAVWAGRSVSDTVRATVTCLGQGLVK